MCVEDPAARSRLAHRLRALRLHRISAQAHLAAAIGPNALDLNWTQLRHLAESGIAVGERWMRGELEPAAAARPT